MVSAASRASTRMFVSGCDTTFPSPYRLIANRAVYPTSRLISPLIRTFIEHLAACLRAHGIPE